jgi:hypothetical protein
VPTAHRSGSEGVGGTRRSAGDVAVRKWLVPSSSTVGGPLSLPILAIAPPSDPAVDLHNLRPRTVTGTPPGVRQSALGTSIPSRTATTSVSPWAARYRRASSTVIPTTARWGSPDFEAAAGSMARRGGRPADSGRPRDGVPGPGGSDGLRGSSRPGEGPGRRVRPALHQARRPGRIRRPVLTASRARPGRALGRRERTKSCAGSAAVTLRRSPCAGRFAHRRPRSGVRPCPPR